MKNLKIVTWNLGNQMYNDKYYYSNKPKKFPSSFNEVINNYNLQKETINNLDADIYLFQEISKLHFQNYFLNAYKKFKLNNYQSFYQAQFNFLNIVNQGKATFIKNNYNVETDKLTLSNDLTKISDRINLANSPAIVSRLKIDEQELVIVNIHLTPYDKNISSRKKQIEELIIFSDQELEQNKFVIIGGDWNMGSDNILFEKFTPNYKMVFPENKTNRSLTEEGSYSIIDGFVISKNIQITSIDSTEDFRASDHAPVVLSLKLK